MILTSVAGMFCAGYGSLPNSAAIFRFSSARTPSCIRKSAPKTRVSAGAFCTAGKSASRPSREYSEAGGAWGRRLHSARLYCCEKAHRSLPRCAAAFLCCLSCFLRQFFHNPALALFFADFSQRRNPLRFGKLRLLFGTFPAQRYHFVRAVSSI